MKSYQDGLKCFGRGYWLLLVLSYRRDRGCYLLGLYRIRIYFCRKKTVGYCEDIDTSTSEYFMLAIAIDIKCNTFFLQNY